MPNLIFDSAYLKQNTVINDNVDDKILSQCILMVQQDYIEDLLGTQLYNQILSQIGSNTVSSANQTLLDSYVIPAMRYYVLADCSWIFQYRFWNKGILESSSDNAQPVDFQRVKFVSDQYKNKAEQRAQRCTRFLQESSATYPLYTSNSHTYESRPNKNNFRSGFVLDDPDCGCNYNNIDPNP